MQESSPSSFASLISLNCASPQEKFTPPGALVESINDFFWLCRIS
jgi:hypothetical protein